MAADAHGQAVEDAGMALMGQAEADIAGLDLESQRATECQRCMRQAQFQGAVR
ncbi:hypothetical protein D3C76_1865530 [compost metagenome]